MLNALYRDSGVTATLCDEIVRAAEARGVPRQKLDEALGISEAAPVASGTSPKPEQRVSVDGLFGLWTCVMRESKSDGLPIAVGQRASYALYGIFGYSLYTARSAEEVFQRMTRYHDLINNTGRWRYSIEGSSVRMSWRRDGERSLAMRVANEQVLASFVTVARQIFGPAATFESVSFSHASPADTSEHAAHFGCPLEFDALEDAIVMPRSFLGLVPLGCDAGFSQHFLGENELSLRRLEQQRSYRSVIAQHVAEMLDQGIPTCAEIARRLGTSDRTLRRRVLREKITFEQVLASVQQERAMASMRRGTTVREAAHAAGFVNASCFARAFRRWTGEPPSVALERLRREQTGAKLASAKAS